MILLITIVVAWNYGWVENRDKRINMNQYASVEDIQDKIEDTEAIDIEKTTSPE